MKFSILPAKLAPILQILLQRLNLEESRCHYGSAHFSKIKHVFSDCRVVRKEGGRMKEKPKLVQGPSLCNLQIGLQGAFKCHMV